MPVTTKKKPVVRKRYPTRVQLSRQVERMYRECEEAIALIDRFVDPQRQWGGFSQPCPQFDDCEIPMPPRPRGARKTLTYGKLLKALKAIDKDVLTVIKVLDPAFAARATRRIRPRIRKPDAIYDAC